MLLALSLCLAGCAQGPPEEPTLERAYELPPGQEATLILKLLPGEQSTVEWISDRPVSTCHYDDTPGQTPAYGCADKTSGVRILSGSGETGTTYAAKWRNFHGAFTTVQVNAFGKHIVVEDSVGPQTR
jgi:hypothetical protein